MARKTNSIIMKELDALSATYLAALKTSEALVPPKPKELESTARTFRPPRYTRAAAAMRSERRMAAAVAAKQPAKTHSAKTNFTELHALFVTLTSLRLAAGCAGTRAAIDRR